MKKIFEIRKTRARNTEDRETKKKGSSSGRSTELSVLGMMFLVLGITVFDDNPVSK